jgi:hypothetical protein
LIEHRVIYDRGSAIQHENGAESEPDFTADQKLSAYEYQRRFSSIMKRQMKPRKFATY